MDWNVAETLLGKMTHMYTQDTVRKMTFDKEIFPLLLRFENDERSWDLYDSILKAERMLIRNLLDN